MKQNQFLTKEFERVDVTKEMKEKCFKKTKGYESTIGNVEKEQNKKLEDYIKEFKENKISFDGKTIPEFIDTIEDVRARKAKIERNNNNVN